MIAAVLGLLLLIAASDAFAAAAPHDFPGITSSRDLRSGVVPLKAGDLRFYTKILRSAVDRYQHPTPKDLADIAEAARLHQLQSEAQAKMADDFKTGDLQLAAAEVLHPTAEQAATLQRAEALTGSGVPQMLAAEAGMPLEQWGSLRDRVEAAAGLDTHAEAPAITAWQKSRVKDQLRTEGADKEFVAPAAPEIRRLAALVRQLATDAADRAGL